MNSDKPRRPYWMSKEDYAVFVKQHATEIATLIATGDEPTIDHRVPSSRGGGDDLGNLCVKSRLLNSVKGNRPDPYWMKTFYWDQEPDFTRFRAAQRDEAFYRLVQPSNIYYPLVEGRRHSYHEWFSRAIPEISGLVYILAHIVGAGKTLCIPALAFAYNTMIRQHFGPGVRRADRILVMAKERAVRDQLAYELTTELTKYGIVGSAPRVALVGESHATATQINPNLIGVEADSLLNQGFLEQRVDIAVACVQQFWNRNGQAIPNLEEILYNFPLGFFDEPHFAAEQAVAIAKAGRCSLYLGLTGSPIKADGTTLKHFVLFSVFDYDDANRNDNSLKYLADSQEALNEIVTELGIDGAEIQMGVATRHINSPAEIGNDYRKSFEAAKNVARATINSVELKDALMLQFAADPASASLAPHRPRTAIPDILYYSHALISIDNVEVAQMLQEDMNRIFESDPNRYPRHLGWHAEIVHAPRNGEDDRRPRKERRLTPDHPWLLAKRTDGKLVDGDQFSSRFLLVIGMGREGVNNPYANTIGVAYHAASMIEHVQRTIGRLLRALVQVRGGVLHCPPRELDRPTVITHASYGNRVPIEGAVCYLVNMREKLKELVTVDDLIDRTAPPPQLAGIDVAINLTATEKVNLIQGVGKCVSGFGVLFPGAETPDPDSIVDVVLPKVSPARRAKARDFVQGVIGAPASARTDLKLRPELEPVDVVTAEFLRHEPTNRDLESFVRSHYPPEFRSLIAELDTNLAVRNLLRHGYSTHIQAIHDIRANIGSTLDDQKTSMVFHLYRVIQSVYTLADQSAPGKPDGLIYQLVGVAVKKVFGCPDAESVKRGSVFDTPHHVAILARADIREAIFGWVIEQLIRKGRCPDLARALGYDMEEP